MFATHIAAFIVGAVALLVVQQLRIDKIEAKHGAAIAALVQEHAIAAEKQRLVAMKDQAAITSNYEKALNDARTREPLLRVDRDSARAATDRLRLTARAAASRIHLPETPPAAIRGYAELASELLASCTEEYQSVAGEADQLSSDLRLIKDAWPSTAAQ